MCGVLFAGLAKFERRYKAGCSRSEGVGLECEMVEAGRRERDGNVDVGDLGGRRR